MESGQLAFRSMEIWLPSPLTPYIPRKSDRDPVRARNSRTFAFFSCPSPVSLCILVSRRWRESRNLSWARSGRSKYLRSLGATKRLWRGKRPWCASFSPARIFRLSPSAFTELARPNRSTCKADESYILQGGVDGLRRLAVQKASWRMYSWLRNLEPNQKSARVRHVRRYRDCNLVYGLASYPEGTVICKAAEQESVEQGLFLRERRKAAYVYMPAKPEPASAQPHSLQIGGPWRSAPRSSAV